MGTGEKIIKDNVHGYIYIDKNYFEIIDTALFQRLKNIKQTSYVSLYPSSTHDRFIHSLGTFHLGKQVIRNIISNLNKDVSTLFDEKGKQSIIYTFEVACLLHDVGHAPFSHTSEDFYSVKKMDETIEHKDEYEKYVSKNKIGSFCHLDARLLDELYRIYPSESEEERWEIEAFMEDFADVLRKGTAKPHEKMSALLSLSQLQDKINAIGKKVVGCENVFMADLFVRCITGVQYTDSLLKYDGTELSQKCKFYNAVISLLNSDVIDVDKLDYILRDNYMTGYVNAGIDVERLIKSFTIVIKKNYGCILAYKKNALSVIESVVRASDSSKRWVQNHPIILYDTYITQKCISEAFKVIEHAKGEEKIFEKFFSMDTLTFHGNNWAKDEFAFLASDLDVISLIKKAYTLCTDEETKELFEEYFARDARRHPLWKSEAEYKLCFDFAKSKDGNQKFETIQRIIYSAIATISAIKDETTGVGEYIFNEKNYSEMLERLPRDACRFLKAVYTYFEKTGKSMDIVLLATNSFSSKIKKLNTSKVNVVMPDYNGFWPDNIVKYSDLFDVEDNSSGKQMFYLYSKHSIDVKDFVNYLYEEAAYA